MSQSYVKECIFCKKKIRMAEKEGKWLPFELDNGPHECKSKNGKENGNGNNDMSPQVLLRKLASIGITIDLEKLRNAK
jgi:hypothetical protein